MSMTNVEPKSPLPIFVTIPHSGEKLPDFCDWLKGLPEESLMCDVDRFVDRLYEPSLVKFKIPSIKTEWHRYAADMNRVPEDVDAASVEGSPTEPGTHPRGFHWVVTTTSIPLMKKPMSLEQHKQLVQLIYKPFHQQIRNQYQKLEEGGASQILHIDAHSMPSVGTSMHRDPGETRPEIVISDCLGKSSRPDFVDLVIASYVKAGFRVAYNWPYVGGRVSEQYGEPRIGHHAVQVEISRKLYMNEVTKQFESEKAKATMAKVDKAISYLKEKLPALL